MMNAHSIIPTNLQRFGEFYSNVCSAYIQYHRFRNLALLIRYLSLATIAAGVVLSSILMSSMNLAVLCLVQAVTVGTIYQLLHDDISAITQCSYASEKVYEEVLSHFHASLLDGFIIRMVRESVDLTPQQVLSLRLSYPHKKYEIPLGAYKAFLDAILTSFASGNIVPDLHRLGAKAEAIAHRRLCTCTSANANANAIAVTVL